MSGTAALADARRHRAALAGAARFWKGKATNMADLIPADRAAVAAETGRGKGFLLHTAEETSTGTVLELDARPVQWDIDLERIADRLSLCERGACLRRRADGRWEPVLLGCQVRLCPVCARLRAARTAARWRPVLDAAVADGAELRHWTLTHRAEAAPGGIVTAHEVDKHRWNAAGDMRTIEWVDLGGESYLPGSGRAVAGESLRSAYDRLRGRLRSVRQDRATRELVKVAWPAYLLGVEWTGREPRTGVPRWHAHAHVLTISPSPLSPDDVRAVLDGWRSRGGRGAASDRSQRSRVVDAGGVAEVLKYPFKPAHLTQAQRIEVLASARGQKPHQVGGAFHGSSKASKASPWRRWLDARIEVESRPRLYLVPRSTSEVVGELAQGEPALFTGQIDVDVAGEQHTWAIKVDGEWSRWLAPAAPYLRALGAPASDSELPEPGDDDDD
jgi:hypothetical protein